MATLNVAIPWRFSKSIFQKANSAVMWDALR